METTYNYEALLKASKIFRIAVSGDVLVTELEKRIIDTEDFQRLRGIRQLGTVNLVFPTALHTRFDHSIGTLAIADRMVKSITENTHNRDEQENRIPAVDHLIIRLYALLHDITHVPFGHTVEDELQIFIRHDRNEIRIQRFLGESSPIGRIIISSLGEVAYGRLLAVYRWDGKAAFPEDDAYIYDLVSNTVCADLLDYLARDSYFCYLTTPLDYRFLNFLHLGRDSDRKKRVFVRLWKKNHPEPRRDTLTDLANLLQARYLIAERVYFHHTKIKTGAMIGRAMQESYLAGELHDGSAPEVKWNLLDQTDDTLVHNLRGSSNPIAARLARALCNRDLYRNILKYSGEDFDAAQAHNHDENVYSSALGAIATAELRRAFEDELAQQAGADPGDVLLYAPISHGRLERANMNLKVADMKVLWKGEPKCLKDIDDPIISLRLQNILDAHKMLWALYVFVNPRLTEEQEALIVTACQIQFLVPLKQQEARKREQYAKMVEEHLNNSDISAEQMLKIRSQAAEALLALNKDKRPWKEKFEDVIKTTTENVKKI